jgi:hypothetical protein
VCSQSYPLFQKKFPSLFFGGKIKLLLGMGYPMDVKHRMAHHPISSIHLGMDFGSSHYNITFSGLAQFLFYF